MYDFSDMVLNGSLMQQDIRRLIIYTDLVLMNTLQT